jgi:cation-transporting ATPase I
MRPPHLVTPEALLHEGPDSSLGTTLTRQIALRAVATAAGAGGAWMVARPTGTARRAGTVALVALVGTQLGQTAIAGRASPLVLASAALSQAALVAIVQTPGVSQFFGCTPLGPVGWTVATTSAAAATTGSVVVPWTAGRWRARRHPR